MATRGRKKRVVTQRNTSDRYLPPEYWGNRKLLCYFAERSVARCDHFSRECSSPVITGDFATNVDLFFTCICDQADLVVYNLRTRL